MTPAPKCQWCGDDLARPMYDVSGNVVGSYSHFCMGFGGTPALKVQPEAMRRSGLLQERLQQGRLWRLGNALSTLRFWLWSLGLGKRAG